MSYDIGTQLENENPQTASRLTVLVAVLWNLSFGFLKAVVINAGIPALMNIDDRRKQARTTAQIRDAMYDLLTLAGLDVAPGTRGFLPRLFGAEIAQGVESRDLRKLCDIVALRTYALNPRGVGFAVRVGTKGAKNALKGWCGVLPAWIRNSLVAGGSNGRTKQTPEEAKKNSKAHLQDGIRWLCNVCGRYKRGESQDVTGTFGPMCCGQNTRPAVREGEESTSYEMKVRIPSILNGVWAMRSINLKGNVNKCVDDIIADPFNVKVCNTNMGKVWGGRVHFRIMATLMTNAEGTWRVWAAIPCDPSGDIVSADGLIKSGLKAKEARQIRDTHNALMHRDALLRSDWEAVTDGRTSADRKELKSLKL
jgi:hypothetical protein